MQVPQQTVKDWTDGFTESCLRQEPVNPPGFDPPIYNVWKQQAKSNAASASSSASITELASSATECTIGGPGQAALAQLLAQPSSRSLIRSCRCSSTG